LDSRFPGIVLESACPRSGVKRRQNYSVDGGATAGWRNDSETDRLAAKNG
jgi:hypothetical protein